VSRLALLLAALALGAGDARAQGPAATASSERAERTAALAVDADPDTAWRSERGGEQWLVLDLGAVVELGGVTIDWDGADFASRYALEASADGERFERVREVRGANGGRDALYLGRVAARRLRLLLLESASGAGYGVARVEAIPAATLANPNDFFHARAADATRGAYPRYFSHEQVYWTALGADGDRAAALVSSDGQLEVDRRSFTIEPFLTVDGRFVSWAQAASSVELRDGDLPIPRVVWRADPVELAITAWASGAPGQSALFATYRLVNRGAVPSEVALWLGVRPFQVNPPWQSLNGVGGVTAVHHVARDGRAVWVNGSKAIALLSDPDGFGALAADRAPLVELLARGALPPDEAASDPTGFASGALRWRFSLAPGASREVAIAVPFGDPRPFLAAPPDAAGVAAALAATAAHWRERLDRFSIALPPEAGPIAPALRAALAQILVARAGPALQPGTRTYARSWIRDGVVMASALLQFGLADEARAFLRWYAPFQAADGRVPCCIDERGPDPAPEHDSPGQLVYGVASLYRYERDAAFVRELWPNVVRAVDFLEALRAQRLGPAWDAPERARFRGILPESISHEGYAKNPVHSYWDDAWALRGITDAALAAQVVGDAAQARRFVALRGAFARDLRASIEATMREKKIDYVPASADHGDFDPSATSAWLAPGRERSLLPAAALARTYELYAQDFRRRRAGAIAWEAYTPYELRNVEALVRLGRRDDALFVLGEILGDQRPAGWRGWGEIVWRDPTAPRFIGDAPHAWIAACFVRAARSLFVYERDDGALVLGAGLPLAWLEAEGGVEVVGLRTHRGPLAYRMRVAGPGRIEVEVRAGLDIPTAGIVIEPPVAVRAARLDAAPIPEWTPSSATVRSLPARIEIDY
jgi:hypothetical protein